MNKKKLIRLNNILINPATRTDPDAVKNAIDELQKEYKKHVERNQEIRPSGDSK